MNKPAENGTKTKILVAIIASVIAALLSSGAGMMYRHEVTQLEHARDLSKLRARLYREQVRNYEFHERYFRAILQVIKLRENKEGLSVIEKTRLNFYESQKELVQQEKNNYIETWKHEGQ